MKLKHILVLIILVAPVSAFAFFGSEDAILTKILTEAIMHTQSLGNILGQVKDLANIALEVRRGIEDPLSIDLGGGITARDFKSVDVLNKLGGGPILGTSNDVMATKNAVEAVWGGKPGWGPSINLSFKDNQAIHALSLVQNIMDESTHFASSGSDMLDELQLANEAKATVRNAQASAIQVQQLGQIEANQGLQVSLAAQDILSKNEQQKGWMQVNNSVMDLLMNSLGSTKPLGPK